MTETTQSRSAKVSLTFSKFELPPVRDALVVGKRAGIGINSIARALHEMVPDAFKLVRIEHPVIEGILVRKSDLRKLPEQVLLPRIVKNAERIMDQNDSLRVEIDIELFVEESLQL